MSSSPRPSSILRQFWLLVPVALAGACLVAWVMIPTATWADWFAHPARVPVPATTQAGAAWVRIMLPIAASCILLASLVLHHLEPREQPAPVAPAPAGEVLVLLALIALAIVARLPRLTEGLWYDEIAAYLSYGVHGVGPIVANYFDPSNHIFQTLLSSWSADHLGPMVGDHAIALRLPALVFSLASVLACYGLARLVAGPRVAALTGLLLAIMPVAVLEGTEARGYSQMIFFTAASTWALVLALRNGAAWRWFLYAILIALGAWSHLVTVFVPAGHALLLLWIAMTHRPRAAAVGGLVAVVLGAALTLLLYAPALPDFMRQRAVFSAAEGDEPSVFGIEGLHILMQGGGTWLWWASIPGLVALLIGLSASRRNAGLRLATIALLVGLPVFIATIVLLDSWLYARFAVFMLPGVALLMASGVDALWAKSRPYGAAALAAIFIAWGADLVSRPPRQPLDEAMLIIHDRAALTDRVLAVGLAHRVLAYYAGEFPMSHSLRHGATLAADLDAVQPSWVVVLYPDHVSADAWTLLATRGYTEVERLEGWIDWGHGDVVVLEHHPD